MRSRLRATWLAGALALAAAQPLPVSARPISDPVSFRFDDAVAELEAAQRGRISLQDAVRIATQRYEGEVVRARTREQGGRTIHEIRILLTDGNRVVNVRVDADTGEMR